MLRSRLSLADHEEAILRDIVHLADLEGIAIRTRQRAHAQPEEAILEEVTGGSYNLVLIGVSRRPGDALFFGNTPKAVVDRCPVSVMLLSSASQA
jgi:nucleotide-binding universal stress UspA family protein